jgi:hydroxyethylthiazole kinase
MNAAIANSAFLDVLARVRKQAPRVQCLTNTVAQAITANCLLALGARVSMAVHPAEIIEMAAGADAVLINLGTIDPLREEAIRRLIEGSTLQAKPVVLDPVFVEASPLRLALARRVAEDRHVIIRANVSETDALRPVLAAADRDRATWVITGAVDRVVAGERRTECRRGHPMMAHVTGLGCALGAIIAAFRAVEPDPFVAATAALTVFGAAGERAARVSQGPGSFAVAFVDALSAIDGDAMEIH